jgi:hypothetical protein
MSVKKPYLLSTLILLTFFSQACDPNPPSNPQNTASYTLTDICNRLDTGAGGSKSTFSNPAQGPSHASDCTLNEVMEKAPAITAEGAQPDEVANGKKYWGLTHGNWGLKTGTGIGIGGVDCPTDASRFTNNGNGTVTDNCTKLIWLQNANCWGKQKWSNAKSKASQLSNGQCGLTDNSTAGDWRLPTVHELQSLIDYSQYNPALPSAHPFSGVQLSYYWSSTAHAKHTTTGAWSVHLYYGYVLTYGKTSLYGVWPVRRR